jgi:VWFA-related protein
MKRRIALTLGILLLIFAASGSGRRVFAPMGIAQAQNAQNSSAAAAAPSAPVQQAQTPAGSAIKAETREVRVDVVVTDKKGEYVQDLTTKDFRLYEDNKEQAINTFSFGASPNASPESQRHYMVLFFDNSSMELSDQPRARAAAGKFIDAYANSDRIMSVVNFGGSLQIVQNFTTDPALLKQAVSGISFSAVSTGASASNGLGPSGIPGSAGASSPGIPPGGMSLSGPESKFGTYSMLLSIRELAKNLSSIPGRKSLILFTAGFELSYERYSELTATIDACNKANVAVYPLDLRGLAGPMSLLRRGDSPDAIRDGLARSAYSAVTAKSYGGNFEVSESRDTAETQNGRAGLQLAAYHPAAAASNAAAALQQHGGGGGHPPSGGGGNPPAGGGGNPPKTGTGGNPPKTGTNPPPTNPGHNQPSQPFNNNQNPNQSRQIIPPFPKTASSNQQVMYALASGTGGFPILNTNDLMPGLEKIAREQSEYYLLGYAPADSPAGSCHTLKVKVERGGTNVRARSGFCNVVSKDPLAGKPVEKELEMHATISGTGATAALAGSGGAAPAANTAGAVWMQAPFFYTSPTEARVHLTMDVPSSLIDFTKVKGKYHADVNVLGIAYHLDGSVASRFSDEVTLDLEKEQWQAFMASPMHYENQFSVAPGQYRLSVAIGGGQKFANSEAPLSIDSWDGKKLSLSGIALSNQFQPTGELGGTFEADLLADRTPLVVGKVQLTPSAENHFKKADKVAVYAQIYAPRLAEANPPTVVCTLIVTDLKTGKTVASDTGIDLTQFIQKGNSMIPVGLKLPVETLPPGEYRLKMQASETGRVLSQVRSVNFVVE